MKTRLISTLGGWLMAGIVSLGATIPLYVNDNSISTPPVVDALAFLNRGSMQFGLTFPFETQNTLYFTNSGQMSASGSGNAGFRLLRVDGTTGFRTPAANIINFAGASITGNPYLELNATNLSNKGTLAVSGSGLMRLTGQNVDLGGGKLDLGSLGDILQGGNGSVTRTNFAPSTGVTESLWGTNTADLNLSEFAVIDTNGVFTVNSVEYRGGESPKLSLQGPLVFVNTNAIGAKDGPTNLIVQAVFVLNADTNNVGVDVRFVDSAENGNPLKKAVVTFSGFDTNVITREKVPRNLVLTDDLVSATNLLVASDTNIFLLTNSAAFGNFRPANFNIYRTNFTKVQKTNSLPNSAFSTNLFNMFVTKQFSNGVSYSNSTVSVFYSAYDAEVDSKTPVPSNLPGAGYTNYPGRLELTAGNLNLEKARIRGAGVGFVKAQNLISSVDAQIDVPLLIYDLGNTNGNLLLKGLAGSSLTRFASGPIQAWSATWTNGVDVLTTNMTIDPSTMPPTTNSEVVSTNFTTIFHVLLVDEALTSAAGTSQVTSLKATATNTVFADDLQILGSLDLHADTLTVESTLLIGSPSGGAFNNGNAVGLRYLTNNGEFRIFGGANFGLDRQEPYVSWVNNNFLQADSVAISAKDLVNAGFITATAGPVTISAESALLAGFFSSISSVGDVNISASNLKLAGGRVRSDRSINLQVANSLTDELTDTQNVITSKLGLALASKPPVGNLLATGFVLDVDADSSADLQWPGADFGTSKAGYDNNVAVGVLSLNAVDDGFINIAGISGGKAIYVDFLQLDDNIAAALESHLQIADDFTVYFAASNISAEQLDGALNGRIKWVRDYTGTFSSKLVTLEDGSTIRVNINLLNSTTIDSDGDGIVNKDDPFPFGGVPITTRIVNGPPLAAEIDFTGAPQTTYQVESTASLVQPQWEHVATLTNNATTSAPLSVQDPIIQGQPARYYRVTYQP